MDLHWYLRTLEEVVIRVLSSTFSIQASRVEGLTGVWVGEYQLYIFVISLSLYQKKYQMSSIQHDLSSFPAFLIP